MSHLCLKLHLLVNERPRHHFPYNDKEIPRNGIYIVFERGERGHSNDRIVRIGTHTGHNQLRSRLKQHFLQQNKDRSIFRKNVGRCLLHSVSDPYLRIWELDLTTSESKARNYQLVDPAYQHGIEAKVSEYIQNHFSFCVIEMTDKEERLFLESRLISTVSGCKECDPSTSWLGLSSPVLKIKQSGMWQVNELYKDSISDEDLDRLAVLIK